MTTCKRRLGWNCGSGAILSLLVLLFAQPATGLGTAPGDIAAHVVGLWGDVEVKSIHHAGAEASAEGEPATATWAPAAIGQPLYLADSLRTGRGRVRFEFTDRNDARNIGPSVFNLGEHSQVKLTEYHVFDGVPEGMIDLLIGKILMIFNAPPGYDETGFSVRAGIAVCGMRGTTLTVDYNPEREEVIVEVSEGEVVLTGPGGSRVIKSGQRAVMVNGEFPGGGPS